MSSMILLVEDDPTLRFLGAKQCELLGLSFDFACNGKEAVSMAPRGYRVILMDLGMPDMSGIEATLRIREQEQREGRKRTPIVAMTAYSASEQAVTVGMDDYIQKPVLLDPLRQIVQKWL